MRNDLRSTSASKRLLIILVAAFAAIRPAFAEDLVIAKDGKTDYQLVIPASNPKARWNARFLAWLLKEKTGAEFPIVAADEAASAKHTIYIGVSEPAKTLAGEYPYAAMNDQDHVVRSVGPDILLYGKGHDADFYAVMDFLDNELSFRCYWDWPAVEKRSVIVLKPMNRKMRYALRRRQLQGSFTDYLRGENVRFPNNNIGAGERLNSTGGVLVAREKGGPAKTEAFSLKGGRGTYPEIIPEKILAGLCHTELRYIPCKHYRSHGYDFIENRDYFRTNPEFFGMDRKGVRSPKTEHLCFGNKALRREFTRNVEKHLEALGTDNVEIGVHYSDNCDRACFCRDCEELEKKYRTPGAPLFDYILELAEAFRTNHPNTTILTSLYRESQTQHPPVLEDGRGFPDNVLLCYAGISLKTNRGIKHPDNSRAYEDLVQWSKLSRNMYVWVYYALYGDMMFLPYAADRVVVDYIREVDRLGLEGMFFEFATYSSFPSDETHCTGLAPRNFSMLDKYLFYRFAKNPSLDYQAEVRDFMEHVYGPVAGLAKRYHDELQHACTVGNPYGMVLSGKNFQKELAYLSPENLCRWEALFDEMGTVLGDQHPGILKKVNLLRKPLDTAVYGRWAACAKEHPDYFTDPDVLRKRIGEPSKHSFAQGLRDFLFAAEMRIKHAGGNPLPERFKDVSPERMERLVPRNNAADPTMSKVPKIVNDADAAFGYAASVNLPDLPFHFGYYSFDTEKHGPRGTLKREDIEPGKYRLYHLGEVQPTGDRCIIWFSSRSWATSLDVSTLYDLEETTRKWDAWISLKFPEGFSGGDDELVLCDQIILVKGEE